MKTEIEILKDLTYFKMNMLQAEIEMQSMLAENKYLEQRGLPIHYNKNDFINLIEKHSIYHNAFPF